MDYARTVAMSAVVCLLGLSRPAAAADQASRVKWNPQGFRFHLSLGKSVFSLYEPVMLTYRLENVTESELAAAGDLRLGILGGFDVSIRHEQDQPVRFRNDLVKVTFL